MKWILVGIISICSALGDVLNTAGIRRHAAAEDLNSRGLAKLPLRIVRNPLVAAGFGALGISFFAFLCLLSISNVSFAVPATAISYGLETLLAKYVLKESVTWRRWAAASLVSCGVMLLSW